MAEKNELSVLPATKIDGASGDFLEPVDPLIEKRVIRKCDWHLVPSMRCSSLGRTNERSLTSYSTIRLVYLCLRRQVSWSRYQPMKIRVLTLHRINIGNAKIQGLTKDLHMVDEDYNIALFMFFIPYILLEVPANVIMKNIRPSTWLGGIMFFWGTSRYWGMM